MDTEIRKLLDAVWNEACESMEDGGTADITRNEATQAIHALIKKEIDMVLDKAIDKEVGLYKIFEDNTDICIGIKFMADKVRELYDK